MPRWRKSAIMLALDMALVVGSSWLAFCLRIGVLDTWRPGLLYFIPTALAVWLICSMTTGLYRSIARYSDRGTMMTIGRVMLFYAIPIMAVFLFGGIYDVPRTVALIQPILLFIMLCLLRIVIRYLLTDIVNVYDGGDASRVLIYGFGSVGMRLASSLRAEPRLKLVAIVDDDEGKRGGMINSVPVYTAAQIEEAIASHGVTDVLLALPNISRARRRAVIEQLECFQVRVRQLPEVHDVIAGKVAYSDLREVQVEDLLGRDPVQPDQVLLDRSIGSKCVMVTGAGGSIGSELARQIAALKPTTLVLVEMSEVALYSIEQEMSYLLGRMPAGDAPRIIQELANVADGPSTRRILDRWKPDVIFHAAAYKHVPIIEINPLAGIRNNIFATVNLAKGAVACRAEKLVLVSTDKAVRPTNIMGASKRVCELVLQALAQESETVFAMVRFGNVLGSSGSVVPRFARQIREGGPITLTHADVTRYFMTIPEASQLVIQAAAMATGGEVFVLDMGSPVKIVDLARSMVHLAGLSIQSESNPTGDIEITEVGLRPGEKLYEELLIGNNPEPTDHSRIMRAQESFIGWDQLQETLVELGAALDEGDARSAIAVVRSLVPEYQPNACRDGAVGED